MRYLPVPDEAEGAPLLGGSHGVTVAAAARRRVSRMPRNALLCFAVGCGGGELARRRGWVGSPGPGAAAAAPPAVRERVAVTLEGWIGTTVADGGLNIRENVVDALSADVFLALTYDAADGCGAASPPPRCRTSRLLPAMYEGGRPDGPAGDAGAAGVAAPSVRVSLSPSLDSAELLRLFLALPHWPRLLAAHNAPGSPVACTPAPASASASSDSAAAAASASTSASGYECVGIYKGNSFLAPVLGDHGIHNLHQLHALSLALQLVARTERRNGWQYDRIVHTRLDLQWLRPHPPLHLLAASQAWVPSGEDYYGGLNDRHAVLNRTQAEAYFGRWEALLEGKVMQIEPQLRRGRVERGVAMSNENFLAETLRYHGVAVRRFPAVAHLRCCDGRELCFADGRYERAVPASLNETKPHARHVCGKYPIEVGRAKPSPDN